MTSTRRSLSLLTAVLGVALAGCGSSATRPVATAARIEHAGTGSRIVLSAVGAQRIGIQTALVTVPGRRGGPAQAGGSALPPKPGPSTSGPVAIVPFSAVVYDPTGRAYAFTSPAPLTYAEVPIVIDRVMGNSAYLLKGPLPGTQVVTVGAEELLGVQAGVLAQT